MLQIGQKWDKLGIFSGQFQYILAPKGTYRGLFQIRFSKFWLQMGHIVDFFRSVSVNFGSSSPIWGQSEPIMMPNLTSLVFSGWCYWDCVSTSSTYDQTIISMCSRHWPLCTVAQVTMTSQWREIEQLSQCATPSLRVKYLWSWMSVLALKWLRLAPNRTNLGLFKISFSTFCLARN